MMEMQPYGPLEAATQKSTNQTIPKPTANQIVIWVVLGLLAGGLMTYLIISSRENSENKDID